ncbi:MAG: FAD-binding oxidoreductase [Ignavibacteriae bacterium]|nr:FAD-binding oxidoreductase [Ignavibacteriota bacterium]NOG97682.1 FAD-binding oxidoreductase [Ignavibacteriota bacterium]
MLTGKYLQLYNQLKISIPKERLIYDDLRTLAFGTDAGFYRLTPQLVIKVETEDEVALVIQNSAELNLPITFRAAGTSLSGQAITDSVLVMLGNNWRRYKIFEEGNKISMQPGLIGAFANAYLAGYHKKLGPDPASINSAMVAGIAANNASGMTSGTKNNIYNTLAGMKIIFADGAVLDTNDENSKDAFRKSNKKLLDEVESLSQKVKANTELADRIKHKYRMKNTTGYSLNALVEFDDPIDIIIHLMIGSEGTLGFISDITLNTVPELPHKATSLMLFKNIETACRAIPIFQKLPVDAAEIMDRAALRSVENKPGMPEALKMLNDQAAALLVETSSDSVDGLSINIENITSSMDELPKEQPLTFISDPKESKKLWDVRKGLFPSACKSREPGTTVIIEDINFPVEDLANAALDLQALFKKYNYSENIIWGHSLAGNLHFVLSQNFSDEKELKRYKDFMEDLAVLVVENYDGSLKAEHGTGRNMAPYVKYEWGEEAYKLMYEIKQIFDPKNILNPGVILNDDSSIHLKNLKPMPIAHTIIDQCIECGFCEVNCPSKNVTITPRQRIVAFREIARLKRTGNEKHRLKVLQDSYQYYGNETCAVDGLCEVSCPVDINTGTLTKELRNTGNGKAANTIADFAANNMSFVTASAKHVLNAVHFFHKILGDRIMTAAARAKKKIFGRNFPLWNKYMPKGADRIKIAEQSDSQLKVVYFPSCISRSMGISKDYESNDSLTTVTIRLLKKAGYQILLPDNLSGLCCGMAFSSKGFFKQGEKKSAELQKKLLKISNNGAYPILFDTSPCTYHFKNYLLSQNDEAKSNLKITEPIDFIYDYLLDKLEIEKINDPITIHPTCSTIRMGLPDKFKELAESLSDNVTVPLEVGCCGWAGDRGFSYPELNESALENLKESIPDNCTKGYSTSRTCEIGLSLHSGINYKSIIYLVDECSTPKSS